MKTMKKTGLTLLTAIAFMAIAATNTVKAQPGMSVSFQLFYDELAPHGDWINDPDYGYIWLPYADQGFQPYATNGHWVMTSYGNTWVSNYEWGWAPFHYGRWVYTDYYGWGWVPGYEWGPAWVSWRSGGGYYGWAPLGPSMSISVHFGIPQHHWVFVPQRYICSPRVYSYYVPYRNRVRIYNTTTIINNTYVYNNRTYVSGPRRSELERATGRRVAVREISRASRPGRASVSNRSVSLYRPEVDRNSRTSARPARVADASKARTANRTTNGRASTSRAANSRNTTATRGATTRPNNSREAVRSEGNSRTREAAAPATRTRTTRTTTPRTNSVRSGNTPSKGNTSGNGTNRATRPARQKQSAAPTVHQVSRPTTSQRTRTSTSTQRATPARSNSSKASTQRTRQPSRSTTVKSQSSSRPKASTSSRSQSSRSSATRSKPAERKSSSGRSRG